MAKSPRYRIFISHKSENGEIAKKLKEEIEEPASALLECFLSELFQAGEKWMESIQDCLAKSNLVLLLYTDPALGWEWCQHEVGFFLGKAFKSKASSEDLRVVCLHPSDIDPPAQLRHLQSIRATRQNIKKLLLEHLYVTKDLAPRCQKMDEIADRIANLVNSAPRETPPVQYCKQMTLVIENRYLVEPTAPNARPEIPPMTKISAEPETLALFGIFGKESQWKDLRKAVPGDGSWAEELAVNISRSMANACIRPIEGRMRPSDEDNPKLYRPHLLQGKRLNGAFKYSVLLTEERNFNEDDKKLPIPSFQELICALTDLIRQTLGPVRILCLTPALGFLARPEEEWTVLHECLMEHRGRIRITCLKTDPLKAWHEKFIGRKTSRGQVTKELVQEANETSEKLLAEFVNPHRLDWPCLPDYYAFGNDKRAIIVTPLGLPRLDKQPTPVLRNVEMFGLVTTNESIVQQVSEVHSHYYNMDPERGIGASA